MFKFYVSKNDFKEVIKNQCVYTGYYSGGVLAGIYFKAEKNKLTVVSTDASRLLKTEIEIYNTEGEPISAIYRADFLSKIKIEKCIRVNKNFNEDLEITMTEDLLTINDFANGFIYNVPIIEGTYPKYEQILPEVENKNYFEIGVRKRFLEDLKSLIFNERADYLRMYINKKNQSSAIVVRSERGDTKSTALIMPVQLKE